MGASVLQQHIQVRRKIARIDAAGFERDAAPAKDPLQEM
jgi:hypothetical protein